MSGWPQAVGWRCVTFTGTPAGEFGAFRRVVRHELGLDTSRGQIGYRMAVTMFKIVVDSVTSDASELS